MKEFYSKNKKTLNIALVIIFSIGFFSIAKVCCAGPIDGVIGAVLGTIASIIVELCGWFLNKTIASVIDIASYNGFINNPQIKYAWVVVRDLCNMFFILILLIIAFTTILRVESYPVKKLLPKLLIMAVLINFSRIICGLLIDFSQVIMLTFVNAFKDGGGNFVAYLNVDKFLQLVDKETKFWGESGISLTDIVVSYIAAILFMIIATITMVAILIVFLMRMIMLWIYVVLSPLAFLLSAFPGGQKYAGQYWGEFSKYLINGPVLAFFIWLSLITLGSFDVAKLATTFQEAKVKGFSAENYMHFILAIGMLVGGLMISQQIGGIGASWGANAVNSLKTRGWGVAKGAAKRLSGYGYVSDVTKGYMAMRKSKRDERIRLGSETLAGGIGKMKETLVARPSSYVGGKIKTAIGLNRWKNRADGLGQEIKGDKEALDVINNHKIKDKKDFYHGDNEYKWDSANKKWGEHKGGIKIGDLSDDEIYSRVNKDYEKIIEHKEDLQVQALKRQKTVDTNVKRGMGLAGGALGLATGGLGLLGIAGMGAGYALGKRGIPKLGKTLKEAGKEDFNLASNYYVKQLNEIKDGMKLDSNEKVMAIMDNSAESSLTRAAAAIEAMSRKIVDLNTAKRKYNEFNNTFRGDKKVMGQFEAVLEKNYIGASSTFRNLRDPAKRDSAERLIRSLYENGSYNMKDMDNKTLTESIRQLALGLKTKKFVSQFGDLDANKQAAIIRALKDDGSFEAKGKLSFAKDITYAFGAGPSAEKINFTKTLNLGQLSEILANGSAEQAKALKEAVNGSLANLSDEVADVMIRNPNNRIAQSVKGDLNIP